MRRRFILKGIVQGVGMRPHVARAARESGVTGWCGNSSTEVFIEAQGDLDAFRAALLKFPPLAHVVSIAEHELAEAPGETDFRILASREEEGEKTLLPPDVAMCEDCAHDIADPTNRRCGYPFTTCTNCGPRLSIIRALPYDRPNTTLDVFPLCPECASEYTDPTDRRYHAQPISCPQCGPTCWLETPGIVPAETSDAPARIDAPFPELVARVQRAWDAGQVVAVRGIGGFHLTCDAANPAAIARLRERKHRPGKPLALMVPTVAAAQELGEFSEAELALLTSPAHPVVTVPSTTDLEGITPGLDTVGIMLPYSPLHALLVDRPIVATSGNASGEPLCFTLAAAREQLAGLCDLFLLHDREIHVPVEDSVFVGTTPVRRSRGLAPVPFLLPATSAQPTLLAVGGELKNTFALAIGEWAHVSAHVGDMGSLAAQENFERAVEQLATMRDAQPERVVCDLHPGYATTAWAQRFADARGLELLHVQHHHAHALSLLAEHSLVGQPAAIATLDGTGYGTDGTIWGGEVLSLAADGGFERAWHLPTFGLVGGDRAVENPWRLAHALAYRAGFAAEPGDWGVDPATARLVASQLDSGFGVVETSSAGRLFDAAAVILGACGPRVSFEGEAAMRLESLARRGRCGAPATSWEEMVARLFASTPAADRARQFHCDLAALVAGALAAAAAAVGTATVGLTGGCACNRLLASDLDELCRKHGLELLRHRVVPPTDGGLSLGQAVAGRLL